MEIHNQINKIIKKNRNQIFIKDLINDEEITFKKFYEKSINIVSYFKTKKLKEGSKIMIQMENSIEYLYVVFACLLGNYIVCPIDTEIKAEKLKKLEKILNPSLKIKKRNHVKFSNKKIKIQIKKNSPFMIIFTSGTTGEPKGIQISNHSYVGSSISYSKLVNYNEDTYILHFLPMYYNAGLLNTFFSCFFAGSKIILSEKISGLGILNFWDKFNFNLINSFHLTPEIAKGLTKIKITYDLKKIIEKVKIISTGSYLHQKTVNEFEKIYNVRILSCYGLTEIGGPLTIQNWENTFVEGSVGYHSKEIKIRIKKEKGENHIYIKSPYLMDNYLDQKGKSEKIKLVNGYFNTGDVGSYEKGELIINGRRKDIIKKGAEIISIAYIENIFMNDKLVDEACGVSEVDENKGSKIYIFIKFKKNDNLERSLNRLKNNVFKILKRIEIPDKIIPVPDFPKTYNGKIKKNILIDIYI